jgi:hypothetical protein
LFNFLVFFCCLLVLAAPVQASSPLVEVGVLEDHTATLDIHEVVQQDFEPSSATLARGYSQSAYWVKLTIAPSNEQRLLRISRQRETLTHTQVGVPMAHPDNYKVL